MYIDNNMYQYICTTLRTGCKRQRAKTVVEVVRNVSQAATRRTCFFGRNAQSEWQQSKPECRAALSGSAAARPPFSKKISLSNSKKTLP